MGIIVGAAGRERHVSFEPPAVHFLPLSFSSSATPPEQVRDGTPVAVPSAYPRPHLLQPRLPRVPAASLKRRPTTHSIQAPIRLSTTAAPAASASSSASSALRPVGGELWCGLSVQWRAVHGGQDLSGFVGLRAGSGAYCDVACGWEVYGTVLEASKGTRSLEEFVGILARQWRDRLHAR